MRIIAARHSKAAEKTCRGLLLGTLDGSFSYEDGPIPMADVVMTGGKPVALGYCTIARQTFVEFQDGGRWAYVTADC
jgi:hypothetical protein